MTRRATRPVLCQVRSKTGTHRFSFVAPNCPSLTDPPPHVHVPPQGYVEVLGQLDNPIIRRGNETLQPNNFIDTQTDTVSVMQLYLTPLWPGGLKNTLTILEIAFSTQYGFTGDVSIQTIPIFDQVFLGRLVFQLVSIEPPKTGGFGKRAQFTGPSVSHSELWRQRRRNLF